MATWNTQEEVDTIVKLGGAAITNKASFETLNEVVLEQIANQLHQLYTERLRFIVVHGAGSFGHFQAAESGLAQGGFSTAPAASTIKGFAATRLSVTKLNHLVVSALVKRGIPAVAVSPLSNWTTVGGKVSGEDYECEIIESLLSHGFVPVIHGDAVLDHTQKFNILGGDPIMTRLCQYFEPRVGAVYMTNVCGIYDRPPDRDAHGDESPEKANLIRDIVVNPTSKEWIAYDDMYGTIEGGIEASVSDHDVTGGINAKLKEAIEAVCGGTRVRIVKAGTLAALEACTIDQLPNTWQGTEITKE